MRIALTNKRTGQVVHLFFALSVVPPPLYRVLNAYQGAKILIAFEYADALEQLHAMPDRLMVDSGAYTAWTMGTTVDLQQYADWCKQVQQRYGKTLRCVNLDVIPGEAGRTSTTSEKKAAMVGSLHNANALRSHGINVAEVFHQDESWEYLHDLLDHMPDDGVLCISPRNDVAVSHKLTWQRNVLREILRRRTVKTLPRMHGLAVTSRKMMEEFPYYSVDSSTWNSPVRFGTYVNERGGMTATKDHLGTSPRSKTPGTLDLFVRKSMQNSQHVERYITSLWSVRGVVWED